MKRMLLMAVTASLVALAAPGVASAHHHGKRHHARHHSRHAHLVKFGKASVTTPSGPTTTTPTAEPAGKVASFENGVLTITLADKSTVSGKVTEDTKLRCRSAAGQENSGENNGAGDDEHGGPSAHASDDHGSQGWHHADDGDEDDNGSQAACTTAALAPGAVVGEAELSVSSAGAVWEKVELLQ